METFSAQLALCEGNPPVTGGFLTKASDAELWRFLWSATPPPPPQKKKKKKKKVEQTNETPVIWDAIAIIMTSL